MTVDVQVTPEKKCKNKLLDTHLFDFFVNENMILVVNMH